VQAAQLINSNPNLAAAALLWILKGAILAALPLAILVGVLQALRENVSSLKASSGGGGAGGEGEGKGWRQTKGGKG